MKILLFRIEGLLQSWGEHSNWDVRDTSYIPTKSGVVGIMACCMGLKRNDPRISAFFNQLKMAVRVDRQGSIVSDFHTVQGKPRLAVAGGGYRGENKSTIVSHRYYLQDASFLVAISGDEDLLTEIYTAMMHPTYIPFLGRKACLPSVPMVPSLKYYDSLEMALKREPLSARHDSIDVTAEFDDAVESGMEDSRNDRVNSFSSRQFSERTVYRKQIHVESH